MATYALTFATRAAFDTSLASGDIYNLMQGVTSSKPSVAITATITESGETFACGTNVMIDIKSVGPGDRIMYESTNEDNPATGVFKGRFFGIASKWIDNNYPAQPTQHIMIFKTGVLPARYVDCGVCVRRFGNRIRIAGTSSTDLPWSTTATTGYNWDVSGVAKNDKVLKRDRTVANDYLTRQVAMPSNRAQEAAFPGGNATYYPITRDYWDTAVAAGEATVTQNGKTATLADYDYNYDKFMATKFSPLWPAAIGGYSDTDGMKNTRAIVSDFVANHSKTEGSTDYAAGYCRNYTVNAPRLVKGSWFLGTLKDVGELNTLLHALPVPTTWGGMTQWTSSQVSDSAGWSMFVSVLTFNYAKNRTFIAVPLADLILEN